MSHIKPLKSDPLPTEFVTTAEPEGLRLYTMDEACRVLRISRWSLYQLTNNRRELRSITIGSRRFITADDLEIYIETRQQEASS